MNDPDPAEVFVIVPQLLHDLTFIGVGVASIVYEVDDDIVLKTGRIFEIPKSDASTRDAHHYASQSLWYLDMIRKEAAISRLIARHPHANIVEPLDADHPEGIYVRRYRHWSPEQGQTLQDRVSLYRDILRGLVHLHSLGIAHSDLRIDNVLVDPRGRAVLSDFSASSSFGRRNPAFPHPGHPVYINGLAKTVSEASDLFAMASLMFNMETGKAPVLTRGEGNTVMFPPVDTGSRDMDRIISAAWLGHYFSSADMLRHVEALGSSGHDGHDDTNLPPYRDPPTTCLRERVLQWRSKRIAQDQKLLPALPTELDIQRFADDFNLDISENLKFCRPDPTAADFEF